MDSKKVDETLMDSDPDIEFIEKDSGMSSLGGSKDETPERREIVNFFKIKKHFILFSIC